MKQKSDSESGAEPAGHQNETESNASKEAAKHNFNLSNFFRQVSIFGAAGAIAFALLGLLGYVPGLELFGSVCEGYIPMAPSTAVSFIVLGGIFLAMSLRPSSGAKQLLFKILSTLVALFGVLEVAGHFTGRDLNFEDALVPSAGHLGEIPIARMSPVTGAAFFLAGLAAMLLILRWNQPNQSSGRVHRLGNWGGGLGTMGLGIGLVICMAYLYGSPLLYGQGATIPMALTTALGFLMLGTATVGASGKEAFPMSMLIGAGHPLPGGKGRSMSARKRFLVLALIMVVVCTMVMAVMSCMLYRHEIKETREQLQVTAQSQARLIEAIARHEIDERRTKPGHDAFAATMSQIIDAHEHYKGFGKTGDFTLARREGDFIVFLLRHNHLTSRLPESVPFDSKLAEPQRLALSGLSGTVIGLDYQGDTVLAAYEPVAVLNLGIVAKIDLAEIREPFIRSALSASLFTFFLVLVGALLFFRIANPIIARLETYARDLEKEITERKQAEGTMKESEERFRTLFERAGDALFLIELDDGRFVDVNHQACYVLGYSRSELLTLSVSDIDPLFPEEKFTKFVLSLDSDSPVTVEAVHRKKDGSTFPVEIRTGLVKMHGKQHLLSLVRDITKRKLTEEALKKSKEQYHQAQKVESVGRLAGGISHDLNNLLTPILGYSELLLKEFNLDDSHKQKIEGIMKAGIRARDLVRQLLAFSRKQALEYKPIDITKTVADFEKLLQRTVREDIVIETILLSGIPAVMADIGQIEQVIMNLVVNASDAMPEGGKLIIETKRMDLDDKYSKTHPEVKPGPYVMLSVSDTGIGMGDETLEHMFEPFFTTKGEQGTGLGLATVYGIVKQHGGSIWVYSEPGKGATFKVYLPVSEETPVDLKPMKKEATILKGSETILLAEDNEEVRSLAEAILKQQGYTVLMAKNGREALSILAAYDNTVHLLLTDVVMPEMNGKELFDKAAKKIPDLKVLYMSGYTDNVIAHRGVLDEGTVFIQKPFTVEALSVKVREALQKEGSCF